MCEYNHAEKYAGGLQLAVYFPRTTKKYAGSQQLAVYFPRTTIEYAGSLQLAVYFPHTTTEYAGSLQLAVYFCVLLEQLCCGLISTQQIHCRSAADLLKLFFSVRDISECVVFALHVQWSLHFKDHPF